VDEQEFWQRLEYRICAEFAGFADLRLRYHWCDGLIPEEYELTSVEPHIRGVAYCGQRGGTQERWRFALGVGQRVAYARQIDWSILLPSDYLTGWLTADVQNKTLHIDPGVGYHD
jgi:hypothetical protein